MVISPSVCRAVALFAPARQTVLSGCSASVPPKIFLPLTDGAEYLMVMALPPSVAEVSIAGLAGGALLLGGSRRAAPSSWGRPGRWRGPLRQRAPQRR